MGILLLVFAISIGYATFVENDFDAATAKMLIYNARWFEGMLFLMVLNFAGMIFTRQLYRKSKLNILVIHVSLIIIIIGAALTRYIGFEGQMHIRQGQTTNKYFSTDSFLSFQFDDDSAKHQISKRILLSSRKGKQFKQSIKYKNSSYHISIDQYLPNAIETLVQDEQGTAIISFATAGAKGREDTFLRYGESVILNGIGISFGDTTKHNNILFDISNSKLFMKSPINVTANSMTNKTALDSSYVIGEYFPVITKQIYDFLKMKLMVKDFSESAVVSYIPDPNDDGHQRGIGVANVSIKCDTQSKQIFLKLGVWEHISMQGNDLSLKLGNQSWVLPFSLKLNDFQLDRYPGSMSPSSFASEITLIDVEHNVEKPYRIFMNNILDYRGYRFYQSSYDEDEKGTILSVNHDYWGTLVTYVGYFLLFASLIISLFTRKTRFQRVSKQIKEIHNQRKQLFVSSIVFFVAFISFLQLTAQSENQISSEHAAEFGKLLIQNKEGRIVPVNTVSNQTLVKIYKKNRFDGLSADQVFLGMLANPIHWQSRSMIKVGDPALQSVLGIHGNYAKYTDFFDEKGQYKFKDQMPQVYAKKPALRNMYDKELIYVDERVNVCYMVYNGSFLRVFPIPMHPNDKWASPMDFQQKENQYDLSSSKKLFADYFDKVRLNIETNNYIEAGNALQQIKKYQQKEGAKIIPSTSKTNMEVFYNKINIFKNLFPVFMLLGILLFGVLFVQIFKPSLEFRWIVRALIGILIIAFFIQTIGLGIRWYVAGHAPWSNGYESMIYISWATMFAGFMFMKKSPIILSITSLLTGVTLLTAHMSWMNPEITNLVPVLKSYWLTIHVATITASYGFLALGGLTGFLNLCIMIFRNKDNFQRISLTLRELSLIIELSFTVGLILLVIGNFLGGIWANESWGRYWGWDPKETWSLVTIILYSFILHMRLIPGLRSTFSFNFLSMFAFSSVLMTYFGVNYYLSGLHSYASGDPVPIPTFVYFTIGIMLLISAFSAFNEYRLKGENLIMKDINS